MRLFRLTGLGFACLIMILLTSAESRGEEKWLTYKGAWFEIKYPSDFKVKPAQKAPRVQRDMTAPILFPPTIMWYSMSSRRSGRGKQTSRT